MDYDYSEESAMRLFRSRRSALNQTMLWLFGAVLIIMLMFPLVPLRGILEAHKQLLELQVEGQQVIPDIQERVATLDRQLKTLTTASIEMRLKIIEDVLRTGEVNTEQIQSIQAMRENLSTLNSYVSRDPDKIIKLNELQTNYRNLKDGLENLPTSKDLSNVKEHITLNRWVFSVILAVIGVISFLAQRRPIPTEPIRPQPTQESTVSTTTPNSSKKEVQQ